MIPLASSPPIETRNQTPCRCVKICKRLTGGPHSVRRSISNCSWQRGRRQGCNAGWPMASWRVLLAAFCIALPYASLQLPHRHRIHSNQCDHSRNQRPDYRSLDICPVLGRALDMVVGARQRIFLYRPDFCPLCVDISGSICADRPSGRRGSDRRMDRHILVSGIADWS